LHKEQIIGYLGAPLCISADDLVKPESGAFWPPQVPPNTVLTGFFGALQSSANC
jgi:hypothetical protein